MSLPNTGFEFGRRYERSEFCKFHEGSERFAGAGSRATL